MGKFDQITIVAVNGGDDGSNVVHSICKTMAQLPGSRGLLIAAGRPSNLPGDIEYIAVNKFDYFQYQMYVIHSLHYHIRTDYALIVQDDGWALNGTNWNDQWFDYDYIGAPCHVAGVGGRLCLNYSWLGQPDAIQVMNGGFSLRSRTFLEAPTKYGVCYNIVRMPYLSNEDIQLGLVLRNSLEKLGLKFAPIETALYFSVEYSHPLIHADMDLSRLFGHHAQTRRLRANSVVEINMTRAEIEGTFGETRIIGLLQSYGYAVTCKR